MRQLRPIAGWCVKCFSTKAVATPETRDRLGRLADLLAREKGLSEPLSLKEALRPCGRGSLGPPERSTPMTRAPTLTQWCERYLEVRADDLSEGTAALVRAARDQFVAFLRGDPRIDRIDAARANDWRTWLGKQPNKRRPNRRLSPYTVAMYVSRMRAVFALAVEERRIPANPFARVRVRTPEPEEDWQDVTHADLERILTACPDDGWRCLFALCRLAGTRSGMRGARRWT